MKQEQKIERIRAKCQEILELGKLRTQGTWRHEASRAYCTDEAVTYNVMGPPSDYMYLQEESDSRFIASCAGTAEAMARSTLFAIEGLKRLSEWKLSTWGNDEGITMEIDSILDSILESWPDELL